ncbi:MAG: Diphtheria toxin repressor [Methanobacteriota archaeon]|nr:MAG: Diphtheria toxin repressor [Euryarchaeota archaeon]
MEGATEFEEMYIKRIFEEHCREPGEIVRTSQLADLMGVSSASVTEMIQRLATRDLVTYVPYKGCRLTPNGFHYGAIVKRRQLLIELLLHDVLKIEEGIEEIACKMEHAVDEVVELALEQLFDYPSETFDGRRIPDVGRVKPDPD